MGQKRKIETHLSKNTREENDSEKRTEPEEYA
jgi:hypothetical protein